MKAFIGEGKTLKDELVIRSIKLIDIAYISCLYLTLAIVVSHYLDRLYGKFDTAKANTKSLAKLYLDILLHFSIIGIVSYFARNIVEIIPFPLNGVYGFSHYKMKELMSGALFASMLIFTQNNLRNKLIYTIDRTFGDK